MKLFKDRLLLKIRFNALTSNCCTLVAPYVLACRAGVFWHEPRALTPPSWINRRAEVWNESIIGTWRRAQKKGAGKEKGKSVAFIRPAYERGSVRGEGCCVIISRIVSHMHRKRIPDDYEEAFI